MDDANHDFGGAWTEIKLAVISAYSKFYVTAISKKFDLWYIDPFAGTGQRNAKEEVGGLFGDTPEPISTVAREYPGSAALALEQVPGFDHLRFGDSKAKHVKALTRLCEQHPGRDASVVKGDANEFVQNFFSQSGWTNNDFTQGSSRALVFLDPYGMEVKWKTLEVLARSGKADVWFLANMKAAYQQLAKRHDRIDEDKRVALREYFGTDQWEQFYVGGEEEGLLGMMNMRTRSATKTDVAKFHKSRLEGLFAFVSEPLPLKVKAIDDYFLLYCMSNNPFEAAQKLIARGANSIIKKHRSASRYRSALLEGDQ